MKKLTFISVLLIGFVFISYGQDKTSDIKKLLELMGTEEMINQMITNMVPSLKQKMSEKSKSKKQLEILDKYMEYFVEEANRMTKIMMDEEMVKIYDKHFTSQEITDLITFYESPVGKKILKKMPELNLELTNTMLNKYMPEIQKNSMEKLNELDKN